MTLSVRSLKTRFCSSGWLRPLIGSFRTSRRDASDPPSKHHPSSVAEGKEAVIAEDVLSAYVAEQLRMTPDTLSAAIASLQHSGIVEVSCSGLRIRDVPELEKLS